MHRGKPGGVGTARAPLLEAGFCYTGIVLRGFDYGEAPWVQTRVCEPKW